MSDNLETILKGRSEVDYFYNGTVKLVYDAGLHAYYEEIDGEKYIVPGCTTVVGFIDKSGPLTGWAARSTVELLRDRLVCEIHPGVFKVDHSLIESVEQLDALLLEAKANYRKISKTATDIGHLAHEWLEKNTVAMLGGTEFTGPLPNDPKAINCIEAALGWQTKHNFRPVFAERKFFSRRLGVAGTADWGALIDSCGDPACCTFTGKNRKALGDYKSSKALYDEYRIQTAFYVDAYQEEFPDDLFDLRVILHLGKEDGEFDTMVLSDPNDLALDLAAFEGALAICNWTKQLQMDKKFARDSERAAKKLLVKKTPAKRVRVPKVVEDDIPVAA
jgi:hypothetical protein